MQISAIKIEQRNRGISDELYRSLLMRVTGKSSSKDLSDDERKRVYVEMTRGGSKPVEAAPKAATASKIWALWYDLKGYLPERERTVSYLLGFVRRASGNEQIKDAAGLSLLSPKEAYRTIEALKSRLEQEVNQINKEVPF